MNTRSITQLTIDSDEEIVVSKKKKRNRTAPYWKIGKLGGSIGMKTINMLREVANFDSDEKMAFFKLLDSLQWDIDKNDFIYQTKIDRSDLSASLKVMLARGLKKLREKGLVRTVKRGVYMINPNGIVPNDYDAELEIWNTLKDEKKEQM